MVERTSAWNGIFDLFRRVQVERNLRRRRVRYRTTDAGSVADAYRSMSEIEFDSINGPQEWQNRRVIPRVIQSLEICEPLLAVDLGCGSGQSSQVLGSELPRGSTLLGYDICDRLLARASRRMYRDAHGTPLRVRFINQSIAEPLRDPQGRPLGAGSVALVHAAGVVGHHLKAADVAAMAAEIARVLGPSGAAVLDAGPAMPPAQLQDIFAAHGFAVWDALRAVPCASHPVLVFLRSRTTVGAVCDRAWRHL